MPCTRRTFNLLLCGAAAELAACGTSLPTLTPANDQISLSYAQFPALANPGGSAVVSVSGSFPLAVVRVDSATAAALSATCTHQGCILEFAPSRSQLHCPCHNADFDLSGAVVDGPTIIPLPIYSATVGSDAITIDLR
jgi:nitrite reductase/ring-hydroxylating ferredoxin subunit